MECFERISLQDGRFYAVAELPNISLISNCLPVAVISFAALVASFKTWERSQRRTRNKETHTVGAISPRVRPDRSKRTTCGVAHEQKYSTLLATSGWQSSVDIKRKTKLAVLLLEARGKQERKAMTRFWKSVKCFPPIIMYAVSSWFTSLASFADFW